MGPARVLDGSGPPHLEPGEILVAPVLDAALGPLLSQAAGAVVEIGGLLSHGSVVARELGVPCVVDVRDATRRIRAGERVLVDGGTGRVTVWPAEAEAATIAPESFHTDADPADEAFHPLEAHPLARESVYFNVQDPETGLALVASVGVRSGGRGEALLALALPDGRLWFGLELARPRPDVEGLAVGGARIAWKPVAFCFDGRLAVHEAAGFPPALLPLALAPRTEQVRLELEFQPASPAIDFCAALSEQDRDQLSPLGRHHIEQSGRWHGSLVLGGRHIAVDGTGSRDHSWGLRRWEAADHWRLFTVRFGDDLAVHALAVSVNGHVVEGGFVYRDGRAERITRIEYAGRRVSGRLAGLELEIATAAGPPLQLQGEVWRTITVPVQIQRSWRALGRRPYRLVLHENFTRYTALGRTGHGMAEFTERPR
jgi:phosphohistidine swiveling domain-containing protein